MQYLFLQVDLVQQPVNQLLGWLAETCGTLLLPLAVASGCMVMAYGIPATMLWLRLRHDVAASRCHRLAEAFAAQLDWGDLPEERAWPRRHQPQ